jgi:hypothetical protein
MRWLLVFVVVLSANAATRPLFKRDIPPQCPVKTEPFARASGPPVQAFILNNIMNVSGEMDVRKAETGSNSHYVMLMIFKQISKSAKRYK